jgi:hypothetical protein
MTRIAAHSLHGARHASRRSVLIRFALLVDADSMRTTVDTIKKLLGRSCCTTSCAARCACCSSCSSSRTTA